MSSECPPSIQDEKILIDLTSKLKQQYETLDQIIAGLESDSTMSIEAISEKMKEIKQTENMLQPLRASYRDHHDENEGQLKAITDETIEVVKNLMPKLASLEKASVDSLRRLFPKIQGSVRAVQMQNAYKGNQHA